MKRIRDLHKQVRVVYRACRRIYGKEKTQDECLRVFKVVFPLQFNAQEEEGNSFCFSREKTTQLENIVKGWNPSGALKELCDRILSETKVLRASEDFVAFCKDITPVAMRIRKLTPTECFKLMDVDLEYIRKMQASGLSNSAQYKLAGNSIVVACMFHIFRKLYVETGPDIVKGQPVQLSLF